MPFVHDRIGGIWSRVASYLPAPAQYCQDHNINWTTTSHLARELAFISLWGPLAAVRDKGETAMAAVADGVAHAIPAWACSAKDAVAHAAGSAFASAPAWHFGYSAFRSIYEMLPGTASGSNAGPAPLQEVRQDEDLHPWLDDPVLWDAALRDASLQDGGDESYAAVQPWQGTTPSPEDLAMVCAALPSPPVCLAGIESAAPFC